MNEFPLRRLPNITALVLLGAWQPQPVPLNIAFAGMRVCHLQWSSALGSRLFTRSSWLDLGGRDYYHTRSPEPVHQR